jgi:hypothetical protein
MSTTTAAAETTTTSAATGVQPMAIVDGITVIYDPGLDMLGRGYDLRTAGYARTADKGPRIVLGITGHDTSEPTRRLVEIDSDNRIFYSFPSTVWADDLNEFGATTEVGASLEEYSDSLAFRAKVEQGYGAFSGEVEAALGLEVSASSKHAYASVLDGKMTAEASFTTAELASGSGLSLDASFEKDLYDDSLAPAAFFDRWGTHLVSGIRIGGQIRYTCFATEETFSSTATLDAAARAGYQGLSGSTTVKVDASVSTSTYQQYVSGESSLLIYGGSAAGQAAVGTGEGFTSWITSVASNPAFADFGALTPVWNLCSDPERAAALEETYEYVASLEATSPGLLTANGGSQYDPSDYASIDLDADDTGAEVRAFSAAVSNDLYWLSEDGQEVLVGFGARIDGDHKLTRMLVAALDLRTGDIRYVPVGDGGTNTKDYGGWTQVPDGCVITGIELRDDDGDNKNMKVYYQALAPSSSSTGYLDPARQEAVAGSGQSSYEIAYVPSKTGNRTVITGLLVGHAKNKRLYNRLLLQTAELSAQ